ncbi:MAG: transposase [Bacteroidaceae bacterium]|nr:transposase [Bacteroidaceae bacterium]
MKQDIPDWHDRHYLPHRENVSVQAVTFRLYDSMPAKLIAEWKELVNEMKKEATGDHYDKAKLLQQRISKYEDSGYGQCFLKEPTIADIVQRALLYHHGQKYRLIRWCIMPNHVHMLLEIPKWQTLSNIMHSIRSFTAHEANKKLQRRGKFWMEEYFDRYIRTEHHMVYAIDYIDYNPVKAGLVSSPKEWPWCSAAVWG